MLIELLSALEGIGAVRTIRTSPVLYPALSAAHILSFSLLIGALAVHHLGFLRGQAVGSAALVFTPALAMVLATGTILFACRATLYAGNPAMLAKLGVIVVALANAVTFHGAGARHPRARRAMAALSLALWTTTLLLGRWVAFV